jgi:SM-20-related protein
MVQVNRKAAGFHDAGMIDAFEVKSFLIPAECAGLRAGLRQAAGSQAVVLSRDAGGEVKPLVRRSTRMRVPARTAEQITALLMQQTDALEQRFGHALSSCEPPQFLRYLPGDFFVPHQDGNTPLIHDDSRFRKVSAVIFLSAFSLKSAAGTRPAAQCRN